MDGFLKLAASIVSSVQQALPAGLAVLFFFVMRWPVRAERTVHIRVPPERAFAAVDFQSTTQAWHRPPTLIELIDEGQQIYQATYWSHPVKREGEKSTAHWKIAERHPPFRLLIDRHGIDPGKSSGELMKIDVAIAPEGNESRLTMTYYWGPRPVIAQVMARLDLGTTLRRIKAIVETGQTDPKGERRAALAFSALTATVTLAGLGLLFGWRLALIVLGVLAIHELGHLIAFRLVGQPWGRIVFIPFIGAMAMPRQAFRNLGQYAFASLMGPAFSLFLLIPGLFIVTAAPHSPAALLLDVATVACFINLLNLLPVMPFDGGHVVKAVCQSMGPASVRPALVFISVLLFVIAAVSQIPLLIAPALVALLGMKEMGVPLSNLPAMDKTGLIAAAAAFFGVAGIYLWYILVAHRSYIG